MIYKGGHDQILGSDGAAGGDVLVIDSGNTALGATVSHDGAPLARNFDISFGGSNSLYLDAWGDVIDGSNLQFSDGSMLVYAPEGNGSYSGGAKNDLLIGGTGNTTLTGNAGNDRLQGNAGSDVLNGGNGSDTYVFATGDGTDTVNDAGPNDLLYINTGLFDGEAEKTGSKLCFLIQVACLSGSKEAVCLAG